MDKNNEINQIGIWWRLNNTKRSKISIEVLESDGVTMQTVY